MSPCFFGDSFVNGTGDSECLGWAGRICADARRNGCDLTYYNLEVRRDTSRDIAERWRHEAMIRLPSDIDGRLIFSFGVNDCLFEAGQQRVMPEMTLKTVKEILAQARLQGGWNIRGFLDYAYYQDGVRVNPYAAPAAARHGRRPTDRSRERTGVDPLRPHSARWPGRGDD